MISFPDRYLLGTARAGFRYVMRGVAWSAALGYLLAGAPAWAHVGETHAEASPWTAWTLTPDIAIPTVLVALVYGMGIARRGDAPDKMRSWRHIAFFAGVASLFLALASPVDSIAEHLFSAHQIQHLLLRMIGPMLIVLSAPQAVLISGLPSSLRHRVLPAIVTNGAVRKTFTILTDPAIVTVLFIAALFVWQFPRYHDAALLSEPIHETMHITMLAAGLLFWWRIFDFRPAPTGSTYGTRLMMLWIVILSNIALGAYTTLKSETLYPAYEATGRLFGIGPLTDEMIGGFIIWVPSSMMCLLAVLFVIHMWGRHETRMDATRTRESSSPSGAALYPTTGAELIERARAKNRILAIGFGGFMLSVFVTVILIGVMSVLNNTSHRGLLTRLSTTRASAVRAGR